MFARPPQSGINAFQRSYSTSTQRKWIPRLLKRKPGANEPGVFGLTGLHRASDWRSIAKTCSSKCESLAKDIKRQTTPRDARLLYQFDELSNELCVVLDTAELCRNVHPDPAFVAEAEEAYFVVSSVVQNLNADFGMYAPLASLLESLTGKNASPGLRDAFSPEDVHMVKSLTLDFEKGGIALPVSEKRRLIGLQDDINRLSSDFTASANGSPPAVCVPRSKLHAVPKALRGVLKRSRASMHVFELPGDGSTVHALLRHVTDGGIRQDLFRTFHTFHMQHGLPILDKLLCARRELACILGKESYAELQFDGRLASGPDDVQGFLQDLCQVVNPKAEEELGVLESIRAESGQGGQHGPLRPFDRPFYVTKAKNALIDAELRDMAQYLPLNACMDGVSLSMQEAFGVHLTTEAAAENELWHDSVTKVRLTNAHGAVLGHIFLDLRARPGKYGHAAHFCIRCGRSPGPGKPYQTPVVALVCTFERPGANGEPLLSPSEYETLWHEFGHAMHSLLSRTKYQHLSGTRVSTDFVEIPSHVFEHFAWDSRVLQRIARHHVSGDRIPTRMLRAATSTRNAFAAINLQNQARYAALDLTLHGRDPPIGHTTRAYHDLSERMMAAKEEADVATHASFIHLVGYGAGYYSYVLAKIVAAQIWDELFEDDPFSIEAGRAFTDKLLIHGAAIPPEDLIRGVLKRDASCAPFLKTLGFHEEAGLRIPMRAGVNDA